MLGTLLLDSLERLKVLNTSIGRHVIDLIAAPNSLSASNGLGAVFQLGLSDRTPARFGPKRVFAERI